MANQPENPIWEVGIYQFETTDPVEGGVGGIDNQPLLQLANRTLYLKNLFDAVLLPITSGKGWLLFDDIVSNIPPGWAEVVDMRGRTPFGQNMVDGLFAGIGQLGGAKTKTIGSSNLPAHSHIYSDDSHAEGKFPEISTGFPVQYGSTTVSNSSADGSGAGKLYRTSETGGNVAMDVLNPYRVVLYIYWVGI